LTLIATGLSVGTWSYGKMLKVILNGAKENIVKIPSWPALLLAAISIASKEWLFRITKRVGENLNSQILIANAW
jgi:divalent metal cation (Fe/Co/Zn/Cd) transporter